MVKFSGTVYQYGSRERIQGAIVKAIHNGEVSTKNTDDDGDFSFDNLEPGKWRFIVLHEDNFASKPEEIDLLADRSGFSFYLSRREGTPDEAAGQRFFNILLGLIGVLLVIYILLHILFPPQPKKISEPVLALIEQAQQEAKAAGADGDTTRLASILTNINTGLDSVLAQNSNWSKADQDLIKTIGARTVSLLQENKRDEAVTQLNSLSALLGKPAGPLSIFWVEEPWRFFEVMLWALAGVLVFKIIEVGSYLRWGKFYREGILMHLSHLVAIPLLVLVVTLLLSLVTLEITLVGGNQVKLDLSTPTILVAVSFLLASQPWSVVKFIRTSADRVTGQIPATG